MGKPNNKTGNMILRISETDKAGLRELAEKRGMAMSELVTYLIRREIDFERLGLKVEEK